MSIELFPFAPNWQAPIVERLEWLTDVIESHGDIEERIALRIYCRRFFEFDVTLTKYQSQRLDALLWGWQTAPYYLPVWTDSQCLTAELTSGATAIPCDTDGYDLHTGESAVLWADDENFELVEVSAVNASSIDLSSATTATWAAGTRLYPVWTARLSESVSTHHFTAETVQATLAFELGETPWTAEAGSTLYQGVEVFERALNWIDGNNAEYRRKITRLDFSTGDVYIDDLSDIGKTVRAYQTILDGRAEIAEWRAWLYQRQGRYEPFFAPQWQKNLEQTQPISASSTILTVKSLDYRNSYDREEGRLYLAMLHRDGTWYYRKIISASAYAGIGTDELLLLDSAIGIAADPGDFKLITWLALSRLEADAVEIAWFTSTVASTAIDIRTIREDTGGSYSTPACASLDIVNHDAEDGGITGWTDAVGGSWSSASNSPVSPSGGSYFIPNGVIDAVLRQEVSLIGSLTAEIIDAGGTSLTVKWEQYSYPDISVSGDSGNIKLTFKDAGGSAISSVSSDTVYPVGWESMELSANIPALARSVQIDLEAQMGAYGEINDSKWDNICIDVICDQSTESSVSISANPATITGTDTVDFTATVTGSTPVSYSWTFTGGTPSTSTDSNPTGIEFTDTIQASVSVLLNNGSTVNDNYNSSPPTAGIGIDANNPFYWTLNGNRQILRGGFNHGEPFLMVASELSQLQTDLNTLRNVGGNVIRCTLADFRDSSSMFNPGTIAADAWTWNADYWADLATFVSECATRGIVVQVEFFDRWNLQGDWWVGSPWPSASDMPATFTGSDHSLHDFFNTTSPDATWTLQREFISKAVTTLSGYSNVIYQLANESNAPMAWSNDMTDYAQSLGVQVADMRDSWDINDADNQAVINDDADRTFLERSQNDLTNNRDTYFNELIEYRDYVVTQVKQRPMNTTKIYSWYTYPFQTDSDVGADRMFLHLFSGGASAHFHKPVNASNPAGGPGLGLTTIGKQCIQAAAWLNNQLDIGTMTPVDTTDAAWTGRDTDAQYAMESSGVYAFFLSSVTQGGCTFDVSSLSASTVKIDWYDVDNNSASVEIQAITSNLVSIAKPGSGKRYLAVVRKQT